MPVPIPMQSYTIPSLALHEAIVHPQFADVLDERTGSVLIPSTENGDWSLMDGVTERGRPIIDLFGKGNILKRRDATCKLIYEPVGRLSNRRINATELYGAVQNCQREFYQGDFKDYLAAMNGNSQANDIFFNAIMDFFEKGLKQDLFSNSYFGDTNRQDDPSGQLSWNKFDGITTWIGRYMAQGVIPVSQTFTLPSGTLTPQQCFDAFSAAVASQNNIMELRGDEEKAFYVDRALYKGLYEYYRQGSYVSILEKQDSAGNIRFDGIDIRPKPIDSILYALNGNVKAHLLILTLKGNFLYGYDSMYEGDSPEGGALEVWWSREQRTWQYLLQMVAGTQIAVPEHMVVAATAGIIPGY